MKKIIQSIIFGCIFIPTLVIAQSINTQGAQKGVEIAQFLPKIFNVNLQNTKGSLQGVKNAGIISKQKYPFPEFLNNVKGGKQGVKIAQFFGENEDEILTIVGKEIVFLREVFYALTLNILDYLNTFPDRKLALENHIEYLKVLQELESDKIARIQSRVTDLQEKVQTDELTVTQLENQFFFEFEKFRAQDAEDTLGSFIRESQATIGTKAYLGALSKVLDYHNALFPELQKRITAIEVNKQALIQGVRVTEVEDVDLGLILR